MRRAFVIAKPGDLGAIKLDPPGRCAQFVLVGIGTEFAVEHVFVGARRDLDPALFPEADELGDKVALRPLAEAGVEVAQPCRLVASFGKNLLAAEPPRK